MDLINAILRVESPHFLVITDSIDNRLEEFMRFKSDNKH